MKYTISTKDYSNERSSVSFNVTPIAGDGSNWASLQTALGNLRTAVDGVTNAVVSRANVNFAQGTIDNSLTSDNTARRERKALVRAGDNVTGDIVTFEIPSPQNDLLVFAGNTDFLDMQNLHPAWTSVITNIETTALSKAGNGVTVQSIQIVGRNL